MKMKMFSILDVVVGAFNRPYCLVSRGQAVRSFIDEIQRASEENPMYKHPKDYELYELAEFDDETGQIVPRIPHELVISGASATVKAEG